MAGANLPVIMIYTGLCPGGRQQRYHELMQQTHQSGIYLAQEVFVIVAVKNRYMAGLGCLPPTHTPPLKTKIISELFF